MDKIFEMEKMYRIPIDQREIHVSMELWAITKFYVVDNVGFVLFYDKEQKITDDFIRHHLVMSNRVEEIVIANTKEEAILMVSKRLEGLFIGGMNPKSKAQQIIIDEIEEIPLCPRIRLAIKGEYKGQFMCHMLNNDGSKNEEYLQGCMFSNYDAPDYCPIDFSVVENKWIIKSV